MTALTPGPGVTAGPLSGSQVIADHFTAASVSQALYRFDSVPFITGPERLGTAFADLSRGLDDYYTSYAVLRELPVLEVKWTKTDINLPGGYTGYNPHANLYTGPALALGRLRPGGLGQSDGLTWGKILGPQPANAVAWDIPGYSLTVPGGGDPVTATGPFPLDYLRNVIPDYAYATPVAPSVLTYRLAGAVTAGGPVGGRQVPLPPARAMRFARATAVPGPPDYATGRPQVDAAPSASIPAAVGAVIAVRTPQAPPYTPRPGDGQNDTDYTASPVMTVGLGDELFTTGATFAFTLDPTFDTPNDLAYREAQNWTGRLYFLSLVTTTAWPDHRWYLGAPTTRTAPPMRVRQRDDGLGPSTRRVRGVSSRQGSGRARGYW